MVALSIILTGQTAAFASSSASAKRQCSQAFSGADERVFTPVYAGEFVRSDDGRFRFDRAAFERALAVLLKSVPGDFVVSVTESPVLKLNITSRKPVLTSRRFRLLLTAGVHGNEPLGSQTALDAIASLLQESRLRDRLDLTVLPTLNPEGLDADTRQTKNGYDANREFDSSSEKPAVRAIQDAIGTQPFDLALDLHGANRRVHFFVIKSGDDGDLAKRALGMFDPQLLLHADDGAPTGAVGVNMKNGTRDPSRYWLEAPGLSTSTNKGTLKSYLYALGTPFAYTVEYPGSLDLKRARKKNLELVLSLVRASVN